MQRSGSVTLVGRTNVGKSTFLNTALGEPLAIVSPRPQTTRDPLLGVVVWKNAEFSFIDCPGFHKPKNELGTHMNAVAKDQLNHSDVVILVTDVEPFTRLGKARDFDVRKAYAEEAKILSELAEETPRVVLINKVDTISDKRRLLPILSQLGTIWPSAQIVPISALSREDVERVLDVVEPMLPEAPHRFDPDTVTDRPIRYFATEYIREQAMKVTAGEVPFAVAVSLDEFSEMPDVTIIKATLNVEKEGQKAILIGHGGQKIREIGILSRQRIEGLLKKKVHLELFVKTRKYWRNNKSDLQDLGYVSQLHSLLPNAVRGRT